MGKEPNQKASSSVNHSILSGKTGTENPRSIFCLIFSTGCGVGLAESALVHVHHGLRSCLIRQDCAHGQLEVSAFMYRRPTLYPLEIAVDFLKSL
jgi:hypothetical protein